jgi:hypothetical protein
MVEHRFYPQPDLSTERTTAARFLIQLEGRNVEDQRLVLQLWQPKSQVPGEKTASIFDFAFQKFACNRSTGRGLFVLIKLVHSFTLDAK